LRRGFFYILFLFIILTAFSVVAGERPMMPAPVDRPAEHYDKQKGATIKRDKWGVMDPTPLVIPLNYLPKDKYNFVDWARAIREGIIAPKDSIMGGPPPAPPSFNEDILIKAKLKFMPDVIFPHSAHNAWFKCAPCHPKIFKKKAGASGISMLGIWKGQFCGRCHDKVAFPIRNCFKCHSVKNLEKRRHGRSESMAEYRKLHPVFTKRHSGGKRRRSFWRSLWPL